MKNVFLFSQGIFHKTPCVSTLPLHNWITGTPVSYTHLDVYKRQTDIRAQLVKLTPDEKQYFYHMIVSYIQLKEENARAQKKEP